MRTRFDKFGGGQWAELLLEAHHSVDGPHHNSCPPLDTMDRRAEAALHKVRVGEVSRARQCLTGAMLAPGTEQTFFQMQGRRPQVEARVLSQEVQDFQPDIQLTIDRKMFVQCLKSAPRGSSPGPGGCTHEYLKILLDDIDTVELLLEAVASVARASIPTEVSRALMSARLTALSKPDGGVRSIATGSSLRRLVARILARQYIKEFESECTDCVGHFLRAATDSDSQATILSVDGVGAFDHVLRSTMLERLMRMPTARAMLPFVRLSYGTPSRYSWVDATGRQRFVTQAEGGEQGDPLMPLLFSVGIHGALEEVASSMEHGEQLCAFLDDVYVVCAPQRVVPLFKLLSESLERIAASGSIRGRLGSGTGEGLLLKMLPNLGGTLGNQTGSKFSGHQWAQELSPQKGCANGLLRNSNCGTLSLTCKTSSARGSCSCKVRTHGPTTHCAPSRQASPATTHENMTTAFGEPSRPSSNKFQAVWRNANSHAQSPLYP